MLDYAKLETEIARTLIEIEKLRTEREKMAADREKTERENKLGNFGPPVITAVVGATIVILLGALATVTVALLRATTGS